MRRERFGIAIELLAFGGGLWQTMIGTIPPEIGWPIIGVSGFVGLYLIITGLKRTTDVDEQYKNKAKAREFRSCPSASTNDFCSSFRIRTS